MTRQKARLIIFLSIFLAAGFSLSAQQQNMAPLYTGFPLLTESVAYQQFKTRPVTDYSKIIFLIDRFADSKVQVVYEGRYFSAAFVGRVTRWFLSANYRKEKPEEWIMKWCNTSVPEGNLIWVKFPNGKFRLAREVLFEELKALESAINSKDVSNPGPVLQVNPAAIAQIVDSPAQSGPVNSPDQSLRTGKPKSQPIVA